MKSVFQAQAGVFSLFYQFEAEILFRLFLDSQEEYALLFHLDRLYLTIRLRADGQ